MLYFNNHFTHDFINLIIHELNTGSFLLILSNYNIKEMQHLKSMRILKQAEELMLKGHSFSIAKIMRVLKHVGKHHHNMKCFSIAKIMRVLKLFKALRVEKISFSIAKIMRVLKPIE